MVLWKNIFPDISYHVVQVDIPEVAHRPVIEPGMEISITDQYVQFITGDTDGDNGLAFLAPSPGGVKEDIMI